MIKQAKIYTIVGSGIGLFLILPLVIGYMTIFNFEFAPINLNKPMMYIQVVLLGVFAIYDIRLARAYHFSSFEDAGNVSQPEQPKRPTAAESGAMILTNPETLTYEWKNDKQLSEKEIEAIKTYYLSNRADMTYDQLATETKKYKDVEAIRGYLLNLRRIWGRKGFPQNKTLRECGYKFQS